MWRTPNYPSTPTQISPLRGYVALVTCPTWHCKAQYKHVMIAFCQPNSRSIPSWAAFIHRPLTAVGSPQYCALALLLHTLHSGLDTRTGVPIHILELGKGAILKYEKKSCSRSTKNNTISCGTDLSAKSLHLDIVNPVQPKQTSERCCQLSRLPK